MTQGRGVRLNPSTPRAHRLGLPRARACGASDPIAPRRHHAAPSARLAIRIAQLAHQPPEPQAGPAWRPGAGGGGARRGAYRAAPTCSSKSRQVLIPLCSVATQPLTGAAAAPGVKRSSVGQPSAAGRCPAVDWPALRRRAPDPRRSGRGTPCRGETWTNGAAARRSASRRSSGSRA